jgi:hypothetical protein
VLHVPGSVVSLDARDGTVQWQGYAIPDSKAKACNPRVWQEDYAGCGYSGAAVWSSPDPLAAGGGPRLPAGRHRMGYGL